MKETWGQKLRSRRGQSDSECVAIIGVIVLSLAAAVNPFTSRMPGVFACYGSAVAAAQMTRMSDQEMIAVLRSMTAPRQDEALNSGDFLHLRA